MIEEKKARRRRHFGDRPVVWVPFWGISKLRRRGGVFPGEIPGELIDYDKWYASTVLWTVRKKRFEQRSWRSPGSAFTA